jgi:hypothetical protein
VQKHVGKSLACEVVAGRPPSLKKDGKGVVVKKVIVSVVGALALAIPAVAAADSCTNLSRDANAPAPDCGFTCTTVVSQGNWVWLPSLYSTGISSDPLPPIWGFAPPGAADSTGLGLPGSNGNYTNGQTSSLLGVSAICQGGGNVNNVRQSSNGIQSGCE